MGRDEGGEAVAGGGADTGQLIWVKACLHGLAQHAGRTALDGVGRDDLMAVHQSNHITIAYVDEAELRDVVRAFVVQALTQNISVRVAGEVAEWL